MKIFNNQVAIVTSSGRGIGAAIAKEFAQEGAKVVVNYLTKTDTASRVLESIQQADGEGILVQADVRQKDDVKSLIEQTIEKYGRVDILVNNAHTPFKPKSFEDLTWEDLQEQIDGTIRSAFYCTKYALPELKKSSTAVVVNISSITTRIPEEGFVHRSAAKSYWEAFMLLGLNPELSSLGIRINTLRPGWTQTDQVKEFPEEYLQRKAAESPMGRFATPREVACAVLALFAAPYANTTGKIFELDSHAKLLDVTEN
ncbi:MAG: SDR family oxidoreductase [Stigonema ocellatum SAG 48.90 = DSM 106950]|nr:SDR family oxidoreductase [Stigonema ocellatum SAG 48.90 = DSM 106950]